MEIDDLKSLMNKSATGDKRAFEQIVLIMTPKLIKIVRYYTSSPPEDILQEIWLKIWENVSVLAGKEQPDYWFYTVVRHHCYDKWRETKSKKHSANIRSIYMESATDYIEMINAATADYTNPESLLIKKETAKFIWQNIGLLKEMYALPIYLYYFNDMSLAEISKMLNLPVSTVKWRLYVSRQLLKKELKKYDS